MKIKEALAEYEKTCIGENKFPIAMIATDEQGDPYIYFDHMLSVENMIETLNDLVESLEDLRKQAGN